MDSIALGIIGGVVACVGGTVTLFSGNVLIHLISETLSDFSIAVFTMSKLGASGGMDK